MRDFFFEVALNGGNDRLHLGHGFMRVKAQENFNEDMPSRIARAHAVQHGVLIEMLHQLFRNQHLEGLLQRAVKKVMDGMPQEMPAAVDH